MATTTTRGCKSAKDDERAGAEVVHGDKECQKRTLELLEEMGFPKEVIPLKDLVECGRVKDTGFVWMKQKAPIEHYFEGAKGWTSYSTEITCYIEKGKMKKISGVKSKLLLVWITITDMSLDIPCSGKVHFKSSILGIGKSFNINALLTPQQMLHYNKIKNKSNNNNFITNTAAAAAAAATTDNNNNKTPIKY